MQRLITAALVSAMLVPALGDSASAQQVRAERLLGGNENPPVISEGSGSFRAQLREDRISFRLRYDLGPLSSEVREAHLHIGNPGTNGGVVAFLCSNLAGAPTDRACPESPGQVSGEIMTEDVLPLPPPPAMPVIIGAGDLEGLQRLIRQGAVYANVHTEDHASGEIRGQLAPRRR